MELKIKELDFPKVIEFNFEELKGEITAKVGLYKNMVYTDETIKEAKADKATLNKFVTALEDKRKEIKKECLQPYEAFEKQIKELVSIVNEPVELIDIQVKAYGEKLKAEKLELIKKYWESTEHPEWLTCKQIFDPKWLNASVSIKKVQEAINEKLAEINTHITTIEMLPGFAFEALETYKHTLDINRAIEEGRRLEDIQKHKAEAAERARVEKELAAKAAEQEKELAASATEQEEVEPQQPVEPPKITTNSEVVQPEKQWVKFAAHVTVQEARELAEFFRSKNIEFKAV